MNQIRTLITVISIFILTILTIESCRKCTEPEFIGTDIETKFVLKGTVYDNLGKVPLSGYNVEIVKPSGETQNISLSSSPEFLLENITDGSYKITVSKDGYLIETNEIEVDLPSDENSSLDITTEFFLTKAGPTVTVSPEEAVVIAVQNTTNTSVAEDQVTVEENITVVSIPAKAVDTPVEITVTNEPTPISNNKIEPIGGKLALKTIDFQPEGLVFNEDIEVEIYVGDLNINAENASDFVLGFYNKTTNTWEKAPLTFVSRGYKKARAKLRHFSKWRIVDDEVTCTTTDPTWEDDEERKGGWGETYTITLTKTANILTEEAQKYFGKIEESIILSVTKTYTNNVKPKINERWIVRPRWKVVEVFVSKNGESNTYIAPTGTIEWRADSEFHKSGTIGK